MRVLGDGLVGVGLEGGYIMLLGGVLARNSPGFFVVFPQVL